ncbi:MAG TPA: hypothetical protein VIW68_07960 [Candidatus Sulfotelmatobacter sp.]
MNSSLVRDGPGVTERMVEGIDPGARPEVPVNFVIQIAMKFRIELLGLIGWGLRRGSCLWAFSTL